jgi:hypothetical protein
VFGPHILAKGTDVAGGIDWNDLAPQLAARGLLNTPGLVIGVTRWNDAGKVDYALGGHFPVTVLAEDTREYGIVAPADRFIGRPMLLLTPGGHDPDLLARFAPLFDKLMVLPPLTLRFGGYPFMTLSVMAGTGFRGLAAQKVK